jgi:basic membrane protein A
MALCLSRRSMLAAGAASGSLLLTGRRLLAQEPIKVGFLYVGPIGDFGWTYGHELGRKAVIDHFGERVETQYVENVAEDADAEWVIRQFALSGSQLIFTTSFDFMNPTIRVAAEFPQVKFEHATGYQTAPNLAVYNARFYQGRAVCGAVAGHMSKSGIVGYIGSIPIPEVVMGINAFTLAMQKVRPDVQVKVVWINSWYDFDKEADAAEALIEQGADIICQHTDSLAPLLIAEQRGVYAFGQSSDMRAHAPTAQLTAIVDDWSGYYIERVQAVIDGAWETHNIWWGLAEGMVKMAPYGPAVSAAAAEAGDAVKQGIIDGTLHPFEGPITNQAGELAVPEGEILSDEQLLTMDWYVKGVQT